MKALFVALTIVIVAACTKKDEAAAPSAPEGTSFGRGTTGETTGTTTGTSSGGTSGSTTGEVPAGDRYNWTEGETTDVTFNKSTLETFLARPVNKAGTTVPGKVNIFMGNRPTTTYPQSWAGIVRIAYEEDGATTNSVYREYRFEAAWKTTYGYNGNHTYHEKNRFNGFHNDPNGNAFKAYLQDKYGSILLVLDGSDDSGLMSGRIYFYNFRNCNNTKPSIVTGPEYEDACWLIQSGPYDCRDYLDASTASKQDDQSMNMSIARNPFRTWISRQDQNCGPKYSELVNLYGINGGLALEN